MVRDRKKERHRWWYPMVQHWGDTSKEDISLKKKSFIYYKTKYLLVVVVFQDIKDTDCYHLE